MEYKENDPQYLGGNIYTKNNGIQKNDPQYLGGNI